MTWRTLHTPRLRLEPWGEAHTALLRELALTPAVVRHIGDGRPWTEPGSSDTFQ